MGKAVNWIAFAYLLSSSSSAMTVYSLDIFDQVEDLKANTNLEYMALILYRYASSCKLAGRVSFKLVSLSIVIWKFVLYTIIDLNEVTFIKTKWLNKVKQKTKPFSLSWAVYAS